MAWLRDSAAKTPRPEVAVSAEINREEAVGGECARCGVSLLTEAEFEASKARAVGAGRLAIHSQDTGATTDLSTFLALSSARDSVGVTCAVCGANYCVKCMQERAKPHALSGGLACLRCAGFMTSFSKGEAADGSR